MGGALRNTARALSRSLLVWGGLLLVAAAGWGLWLGTVPTEMRLELVEWTFQLTPQGRELALHLRNTAAQPQPLERVTLDGVPLLTWSADEATLEPGAVTWLRILHPFLAGRRYRVGLGGTGETDVSLEFLLPDVPKTLEFSKLNALEEASEGLAVAVAWRAIGFYETGYLVEPYVDDGRPQRPIYLFADPRFLSPEALRLVDALRQQLLRLQPSLGVAELDWDALVGLGRRQPAAVVVLPTPLRDALGQDVVGLPEALLAQRAGGDGLAALRDWIRKGLVLITPLTTQPTQALVSSDGASRPLPANNPSVSLLGAFETWWSVTAAPTARTGAGQILLQGRYRGNYGAVRELVSDPQALYGYVESENRFSEGPPQVVGRLLHMYNPFLLFAGDGGWMAFSDKPPPPQTQAQDLIKVLLQQPWSGRPLAAPNPVAGGVYFAQGGRLEFDQRVWLVGADAQAGVRGLLWAVDEDTGALHWVRVRSGRLP